MHLPADQEGINTLHLNGMQMLRDIEGRLGIEWTSTVINKKQQKQPIFPHNAYIKVQWKKLQYKAKFSYIRDLRWTKCWYICERKKTHEWQPFLAHHKE